MKNKIVCTLMFIMLIPAFLFAGGEKEGPENSAVIEMTEQKTEGKATGPEAVTITDSSGREVPIQKPVKTIAVTHYSMGEALNILDAWDMVVGRYMGSFDPILCPDGSEVPVISGTGGPYDLNYEKIFELKPDIILTAFVPMPGYEEMLNKLEPEIPVVTLNLYDPDTIVENFRKVGLILGKENEVEEFIEFYERVESEITAVTAGIPEKEKPRMFYKIEWGNPSNITTYSEDRPGFPHWCDVAGCVNISADLPGKGGWVQEVDPEWLISQDIDVIIVDDCNPKNFGLEQDDISAVESGRNAVLKMDLFSGSDAIKNENVYLLSSDLDGTPGHIVGMAYMAKYLHPDLFKDFDTTAIHQEYLTRFMHIDYDLSKHGLFVYPAQ